MGNEPDAMWLVWLGTVLWIGWPLHLIAKHLAFIVKQIKDRTP